MSIGNEKGNVMIIASIVVVIAIANVYVVMSSFQSSRQSQKKANSVSLIDTYLNSVVWTINHDGAWKATVAADGNMNCLQGNGSICPMASQYVTLRLEDTTTVLAYGNPNIGQGFDSNGTNCAGFNPTVPNDQCPFGIEIKWTPLCSAAGCPPPTVVGALTGVAIDPKVQIDIRILYSGTDKSYTQINFKDRFERHFIRGMTDGDLAANCRSLMGDFDSATQTCKLSAKTCPTGQVLYGFDAAGNPVCQQNFFLDQKCNPSEAIVEVTAGGTFECWKH